MGVALEYRPRLEFRPPSALGRDWTLAKFLTSFRVGAVFLEPNNNHSSHLGQVPQAGLLLSALWLLRPL